MKKKDAAKMIDTMQFGVTLFNALRHYAKLTFEENMVLTMRTGTCGPSGAQYDAIAQMLKVTARRAKKLEDSGWRKMHDTLCAIKTKRT